MLRAITPEGHPAFPLKWGEGRPHRRACGRWPERCPGPIWTMHHAPPCCALVLTMLSFHDTNKHMKSPPESESRFCAHTGQGGDGSCGVCGCMGCTVCAVVFGGGALTTSPCSKYRVLSNRMALIASDKDVTLVRIVPVAAGRAPSSVAEASAVGPGRGGRQAANGSSAGLERQNTSAGSLCTTVLHNRSAQLFCTTVLHNCSALVVVVVVSLLVQR